MKAVSIERNKPESESIPLFSIDVRKDNGQLGVGITQSGMELIKYAVSKNEVEKCANEAQAMILDAIIRVACSIRNKTEIQLDN